MPIIRLIDARELLSVGGKAKQLSELLRLNIPTPDGYVVTTGAIEHWDSALEADILGYFDKLDATHVAVRSSATTEDGADATWAGQFDTYLFVSRDQLINKILSCVDSTGSLRSTAYRSASTGDKEVPEIAVIVQSMIPAVASGVCFSVHPVTQNSDQLVIEAAFGLGESVVSGQITPDNYVVSRQTYSIISRTVVKQTSYLKFSEKAGEMSWYKATRPTDQKLRDPQIKKLALEVEKIEAHFGYPVDIEWALYKDKLYILQSRPITTLR